MLDDTKKMVELSTKLDAYRSAREKRLTLKHQMDAMEKDEKLVLNELIDFLHDHREVGGIVGAAHVGRLVEADVPIIANRQELQAYVVEADAWDLLNIQPSVPAIRLRQEDGVDVPGIAFMRQYKLSVTKL